MKNFFARNKYFFFVALVACAGFWQVAFFQNTLKWDAIDQYYPWRMFVVECLRNGSLPLWNPYQQFGYPIHADPQSGAWYPVVWLFALFGNYTLYSLQIEFMLHVIFGGIGMMLLADSFNVRKPFSFLMGCAYMLSGFFVGNAQHITFIVAGCWLPFVFLNYKKMVETFSFKYSILFSACCFMLIAGGYPAYTIITFYALLVSFIFLLIKPVREKNFDAAKNILFVNAASVFLILAMSSVVIVSVFLNSEYLLRTSGLTYAITSHGPFSPQALISLLLPLAAVKNPYLMQTDISMSSIYVGLLVLIGVIYSLVSKKNTSEKMLWIAAFIFLLAAFGNYTPVRKWLYDFFPLMDLFRFPAVFRIFAMICFLLLAGKLLTRLSVSSKLKTTVVFLFFVSAGAIIYSAIAVNASFFFRSIQSLSFEASIFIQACIQSFLLLLLFFVIQSKWNENRKIIFIVCISLLDLITAAQLNVPVNVIYTDRTKQTANAIDKKYSHAFTIPELQPAKAINDSAKAPNPLWRNLNIFTKKPAWDGYNSFLLNNYLQFTDNKPLQNKILENNWAYFPDSVLFYSDSVSENALLVEKTSVAYVKQSSGIDLVQGENKKNNQITVTGFNPHRITLTTSTHSKELLVLMQQYFPGWEIFVDGKKASVVIANYLFMSAVVEKGNHTVEFVYKNTKVKTAFAISASFFLLSLLFLIFSFRQTRDL